MQGWKHRRTLTTLLALALTFVAGCSSGGSTPVAPGRSPALETQIDAIVAPYITNRVLAGLAVGVGYNGKVVFSKGYGLRDISKGLPVTADTTMGIGSVTKHFTSAAILSLQAQGKLRIDQPLSAWVPEYTAGANVTLRQMMQLIGGIPGQTNGGEGVFGGPANLPGTPPAASPAQIIAALNALGLYAPPGTAYDYSNATYYLLGLVVARASGQSYGDYLAQRFFTPLGMSSAYIIGSRPDPNFAVSYAHIQPPNAFAHCPELDPSWAAAPGGIVANVADMIAWNYALRSGAVVSAQDFALLKTPVRLPDGTFTPLGAGLYTRPEYYGANGGMVGFQSADVAFNDGYDVILLANTTNARDTAYPRVNVAIAIHNAVNPAASVVASPNPADTPIPNDPLPPQCLPAN